MDYMHTTHKLTIILALALASCDVDDPIHHTPYPNHGTITLNVDWSRIGTGIAAPSACTVRVGEYAATLTGTTHTIDNLFEAATYRAYLYNTHGNIAVAGSTATATYPAGNLLDWFFTCAMDAKVEKDAHHTFTARMERQVRQVSFSVTPSGGTTERIESITGTLGGVAGAMNMDSGERSAPTTLALTFEKQDDGTWRTTTRLLGIAGASQPLTTTVTFDDDTPGEMTDTTDIHDQLDDGNDGDIDLGTEIVETPTEAGFTASITGWTEVEGSGKAD